MRTKVTLRALVLLAVAVATTGTGCGRRGTSALERRLSRNHNLPAVNCRVATDIRWASVGEIEICSGASDGLRTVTVREQSSARLLQVAFTRRLASDRTELKQLFDSLYGSIVTEIGEPTSACGSPTTRHAHWRRGALAVTISSSELDDVVDESWTVQASPVLDPCDELGRGADSVPR